MCALANGDVTLLSARLLPPVRSHLGCAYILETHYQDHVLCQVGTAGLQGRQEREHQARCCQKFHALNPDLSFGNVAGRHVVPWQARVVLPSPLDVQVPSSPLTRRVTDAAPASASPIFQREITYP